MIFHGERVSENPSGLSGYDGGPDAIKNALPEDQREAFAELLAMKDEPLHPDLVPYYDEQTACGLPMVRHPLVYSALPINGHCNRVYESKRKRLAEAIEESDWHSVVFLHERAYRLRALIDYVTGRYDRSDEGEPIPLADAIAHLDDEARQETLDLVADVWVDSENIGQMIDDWRALFGDGTGFFLGTSEEREAFDALPDPIPAYRAGIDDGDWSYSTDIRVAEFFARRFRDEPLPVMEVDIDKARCFGYLTRRSEDELLVRLS